MAGIYVHVPFCKSKCIYCDFYSIAVQQLIPNYIEAIREEIKLRKYQHNDTLINTIYFGGGTPSCLSIEDLTSIISAIKRNYAVDSNAETTLEANPENLNETYLASLRNIGINRLSIGIQSFDDGMLKFLKRRHTAQKAIDSIKIAHDCGFNDISIDLIYGINGRTNEMWEQELDMAFSLPITHISCYCLGIEEGTLLHRYTAEGKYKPADDEICLQQFLIFDNKVNENGFEHYEISNAGKPKYHSRHNSSYWDRTEYLGFGPAAHSYYGNIRSWNIASVKDYCENIAKAEEFSTSEELTQDDIFEETIILGLRTAKGLNLTEIEENYGQQKTNHLKDAISKLPEDLYIFDGQHFSLTAKGMFVSDGIILEMIW